MPTANKFAVLSEVNDKKKTIVVSDNHQVKKLAKKASAAADKPAAPAAKPAAKASHAAAKASAQTASKKPSAGATKSTDANVPTDLRAAMEFNRKKAEEKAAKHAAETEARAVADRAAAEAAAVRAAADQAQAETQGAADAAKEANEEAAAAAAENTKAAEPVAPPKPVMTMDAYNKARAENMFAIGAKARREVDSSALKSLQKKEDTVDELVIKAKEEPKPAAKGAAKKNVAAPAPKSEKKEKAGRIDLNEFADFSNAPRGRGRGGYSGEDRGRGGFRGGFRGGNTGAPAGAAGGRMPNVEDKRAFPTL